jgi:hypothetical protein
LYAVGTNKSVCGIRHHKQAPRRPGTHADQELNWVGWQVEVTSVQLQLVGHGGQSRHVACCNVAGNSCACVPHHLRVRSSQHIFALPSTPTTECERVSRGAPAHPPLVMCNHWRRPPHILLNSTCLSFSYILLHTSIMHCTCYV